MNSNRRLAFINNSQNCNFAYIYKSLNVHKNCNILLFFLILLFEYRRIDSFRFEESRFWTIFHPMILSFINIPRSIEELKHEGTGVENRGPCNYLESVNWSSAKEEGRRRRQQKAGTTPVGRSDPVGRMVECQYNSVKKWWLWSLEVWKHKCRHGSLGDILHLRPRMWL